MTKAARIKIHKTILKEEGFDPQINDEGNLTFKFESSLYVIEIEEEDVEFFRLTMRNFCVIENASGHLNALIGALHATAETKVAKVSVIDGDVVASIQLFLGSPEHFRPVIIRSLNALKSAVNRFFEFPPADSTSIF